MIIVRTEVMKSVVHLASVLQVSYYYFLKVSYYFLHSPSLDLDLLTLHNSAGASLAVVMGRLTTVAVGEKKSQFYFDNGALRTTEGLFVSLPG